MQTFKHYVTMCGDKLTRKGVYYKNTKTLNEKENITQKPLKRKKKKEIQKVLSVAMKPQKYREDFKCVFVSKRN